MPRPSGWPGAKLFLIIVLVSPILEEIVFRGGLQARLFDQPRLARSFGAKFGAGVSYANIMTSLIFAVFHALSQPLLWAAAVFIPSLVFGWARDRTGSVFPGMVLHAWYNLGFVMLFVR